ncbi:MAG: hypothetical protein JW741_20695, partial [Sedimentisphaerales bacterium]|nr:hypothetical protein [Sedimentisphaerales bacterium]
MFKKSQCVWLMVLSVSLIAGPADANLIVNGSFESPQSGPGNSRGTELGTLWFAAGAWGAEDVDGWDRTDRIWHVTDGGAGIMPDGEFAESLDASFEHNGIDVLSQSGLNLKAGTRYLLTFYLWGESGNPRVLVTLSGPETILLLDNYESDWTDGEAEFVSARFVPNVTGEYTIEFSGDSYEGANVHYHAWIDDVYLDEDTIAIKSNPADGAMIETTSPTLRWEGPGLSHNVYFGESFDAVDQATPEDETFMGNQTELTFLPPDLTPGQTYYWRVDEVDDSDPNSPWKGHVWSFWIRPAAAWSPAPTNGIAFVDTEGDLTWEPGLGALFHTVYFGASFDEVNDAVAGGFMTADAAYDPGPLELDTTYYWRVDEFSMSGTLKGEVWSFRTLPEIPVADDPNLVLWYTLDEGNGATAVDWSGHGHHGSILGRAQWVDGAHGGALDFDGISTCIDMDDAVAESTLSLAMWLKPRDIPYTTGYYAVLHNDQWNAGSVHVHLRANTSLYGVDINGGGAVTSTTVLRSGEWYHLAALIDAAGTGNQLYVNGVLESTAAPAGTPYLGPLNFGAWTNNQRFYHGLMDDIRIYDDLLAEEEIQQLLRGDPLLAWTPHPDRAAIVDIRDATSLNWQAGDTAASHDVYFGADRDAVAAADEDAPEFQGNQPGTGFSLAGLVEFGGGDYFWRIDEVEADETVHTGNIWMFSVPDFLTVDDFESYSNEVGSRAFEKWIDGIGFTQPVDTPGNMTGAMVGHDIWSVESPYYEGTIMETANVHGGAQALPIYYDNTVAPAVSEADRTFTPGQNWTAEGVTTLVVHFRGAADNTGDLYV